MAPPEHVVVHPLVLLSVVDHYTRVAKDTKRRVVGVLLGETYQGRVDVSNSFAGAFTVKVVETIIDQSSVCQ
jgi:26S proteasome regulatory subunit N8